MPVLPVARVVCVAIASVVNPPSVNAGRRCHRPLAIAFEIKVLIAGKQRPEDSSVFVGDGNQCFVVANAFVRIDDPATEGVLASVSGVKG